jgi:iron complex outermembrane receptor protein
VLAILTGAILVDAQAQEAEPEPQNVLQEITVTAQKRVERLQDVPVAVTVVGEQQLQQQRVYTIADLARTSPSLEMIQAFGGPGGGGQIRGVGTQSFTRSAEGAVGIVVDGVPQGNVPNNAVFDIARVEVLRGPQGTLFGLTSSAGVINMATIAPNVSEFSGMAHVDLSDSGKSGSQYGQQTIRGAVNVPLSASSALRVSVNGNRVDGVQRNALTGEDNVLKDGAIRARYLWNASDAVTVNLAADYDKRTQNYFDPQFVYVDVPAGSPLAGELATCGIVASYSNNARCSNLPANGDVKNYGASAQIDWELGGGTLTAISGYRKNKQAPSSVDIMGTPAEFTQIFFSDQTGDGRQFSQELRYASPSGQSVEYVAGLFYSDYQAHTGYAPGGGFNVGTFQLAPFFIPFAHDGSSTSTTNKSAAAFGQATWHVTPAFGLLGGLRYTHQKLTDAQSTNPYDPASVATRGATNESNVSGKIGAQYKFSEMLSGYATVTRGYKGPQVIPAALGSPSTVIGPEIPTAYEIGIKGAGLDGRLGYDVSAFYTKVRDYQGQRCRINGVGVLVCLGESIPSVKTKGIELDVFGRPAQGLTLNAGFIYNEAEFPDGWTGYNPNDLRDPVPGTLIGQTDLSGRQIVGVPKKKLTLATDYGRSFGAVEGFIGADAVYKSAMRLAYTGDDRFIYPAHWTVGAHLGIRSPDDHWRVELFGRNLGDEHEPATLFGGPAFVPPGVVPFLPNGAVSGISGWTVPTSLRQVGLSAEFRW